jgi:hypothetical protein
MHRGQPQICTSNQFLGTSNCGEEVGKFVAAYRWPQWLCRVGGEKPVLPIAMVKHCTRHVPSKPRKIAHQGGNVDSFLDSYGAVPSTWTASRNHGGTMGSGRDGIAVCRQTLQPYRCISSKCKSRPQSRILPVTQVPLGI